MVHLVKSSTGFMVVITAVNGEALVSSEILVSKQSAWKNIFAIKRDLRSDLIYVQDETSKKPKLYYLQDNEKFLSNDDITTPVYISGKNKN